jgi:hypothetical protein
MKLIRRLTGALGAVTATTVALVVLAVGITFALVVINLTTSVSSNEFATPTTTTTSPPTTTTTTIPTAPGGEGLRLALGSGPFPGDCGAFSQPQTLDLGPYSFDLNTGSSSSKFLCVRNNSGFGSIGTLDVDFATASSGEAGCSTAEGLVDPEGTDCGTVGELVDIIEFVITQRTSLGVCKFSETVAPGGTGSLLSSGSSLLSGDTCVFQIDIAFTGTPSDTDKAKASTDTAAFTVAVNAAF